jgi:hypothetical protein
MKIRGYFLSLILLPWNAILLVQSRKIGVAESLDTTFPGRTWEEVNNYEFGFMESAKADFVFMVC